MTEKTLRQLTREMTDRLLYDDLKGSDIKILALKIKQNHAAMRRAEESARAAGLYKQGA